MANINRITLISDRKSGAMLHTSLRYAALISHSKDKSNCVSVVLFTLNSALQL